ncbi:MAG: archease [Solirubrobacteraceae bacterium]
MSFRWADHVGELELRVDAADEAGVFVEALHALGELLAGDEAAAAGRERFDVAADGAGRAVLLAAWLEELNFLAETEGVVPVDAEELVLEPEQVRARLVGYRGRPPHLVKAVTYHRLSFEPHDGGWQAVVVLDV